MKKNWHFFPVLCALICFVACRETETKSRQGTFKVDPSSAKPAILNEIASDIKVVALDYPDSIFFGDIFHIKSTEEHIILHDQSQTASITVFNKEGEFVSQLMRRGKGPGEYINLFAFAVDGANNELILYERNRGFKFYTYPDFDYIKSVNTRKYFQNIEFAGERILTVSDSQKDEASYHGLEFFDPATEEFVSLGLPDGIPTIELSYPNTITNKGDHLLYASAGHINNIYRISDDSVEKTCQIDFGEYNLPEIAWQHDNALDFERELISNTRAVWPHNLIMSNGSLSFFFVFDDLSNRSLAVCKDNNNCKVYSSILLYGGYEAIPPPVGIFQDYYISIIYPEFVEDLLPEDEQSLMDWQIEINKHRNSEKPVLLMYKLT